MWWICGSFITSLWRDKGAMGWDLLQDWCLGGWWISLLVFFNQKKESIRWIYLLVEKAFRETHILLRYGGWFFYNSCGAFGLKWMTGVLMVRSAFVDELRNCFDDQEHSLDEHRNCFDDHEHSLNELRGFFFHTLFLWTTVIVLNRSNF